MANCTAIILAAGAGKRMNSNVHKQYIDIKGKPVLYYSLKAFEDSPLIQQVVLVTGGGEEEYCKKEILEKYQFRKVTKVVAGGKERYHSVANGLSEVSNTDYIFIHDGARPFVTGDIIERCYDAVCKYRACVAGVRSKDTIKIEDGNGMVSSTPNRNCVWQVQTPQVFEYGLIRDAYEKLLEKEEQLLADGVAVTDDTMVLELFSTCPIRLVEAAYTNIKITTPEDLEIAEIFCSKM